MATGPSIVTNFRSSIQRMKKLRDEHAASQNLHENRRHALDLHLLEIEDLKQQLAERTDALKASEAAKSDARRVSSKDKDQEYRERERERGRRERGESAPRPSGQGPTAPGPLTTGSCRFSWVNKRRHCHLFLSKPVVRQNCSNPLTHLTPPHLFCEHESADVQCRGENHECPTVNRQTCRFPAWCVHSSVGCTGEEANVTVRVDTGEIHLFHGNPREDR